METVTEGPGFVTGEDRVSFLELFAHPAQQAGQIKHLGGLGRGPVDLGGDDVAGQVRVDADFKHRFGLIYLI